MSVDENEVAGYFGVQHPPQGEQTEEEKTKAKEMELKKTLLAQAYAVSVQDSKDEILYLKYMNWVDVKGGKNTLPIAKVSYSRGRYGQALENALKAIKEADPKEKAAARAVRDECFEKLNWQAWKGIEEDHKIGRDPPVFAGF